MQKFLQLINGNKTLIWTVVTGALGMLGTLGYLTPEELGTVTAFLAILGKLASKYTK